MGIIQNLKKNKERRLAAKAEQAGTTVDKFKHDRKEKRKETLSNLLGGGERGLLTQKKKFNPTAAEPGLTEAFGQAQRDELEEDNKKAITSNLSSMIKGPEGMDTADITNAIKGTPMSRGGGYKVSSESPMDRSDMSSNASAIYRKKKGWNW